MPTARTDVAIIGAGQAGLATSWRLTERGVGHIVLEAGEIGHAWRTRRWRSFHLVSPNSLNQLPGFEYDGPDPDGFATTAEFLDYLDAYATSFDAPVERGRVIRSLRVRDDGRFELEDHSGTLVARAVVVATGAFGERRVPRFASDGPDGILQLHSDDYWAPESLPDGGVLVVGAGQAGFQIADELALSGRPTWISVGRFGWAPRRPFGRDQMYWRDELGDYARIVNDPAEPRIDYPFSPMSRWGPDDFHLRTLVDDGVVALGHVRGFDGAVAIIEDDLAGLLTAADDYAEEFVARVFDHARAHGLDVADMPPRPDCWSDRPKPTTPTRLDLDDVGIAAIVWATGYRQDHRWIAAPILAPNGAPYLDRGMSRVPGLGFMGLHRMHAAASGTVLGVNPDSALVADAVAAHIGA